MLNYLKAFSVFFIWVIIALTLHSTINYYTFGYCLNAEEDLKKQTNKISNNLAITVNKTDTLFTFSKGFTIKKNENTVSTIPFITDSIKNYMSSRYDKQINITGKFSKNEVDTNIGFQRAKKVKNLLLAKQIHPSTIILKSKLANFTFDTEDFYTNGVEINFENIPQKKIDSIEFSIANKRLYVDFENNELIANKNLKEYCIFLKIYIQKNPSKKIEITGHTDNRGYYENNLIIGKIRAEKLKQYFVENGIENNKILVFSKGESEPIADKNTEEGKIKNRRIEIKIK
jgi:outer membrane protein OmpA-like peptidoglycan-associated protein